MARGGLTSGAPLVGERAATRGRSATEGGDEPVQQHTAIGVFRPCILAALCSRSRFQSGGASILARAKSVSLGAR